MAAKTCSVVPDFKKLFQNPSRLAASALATAVVGAVGWQLFTQWNASRKWETSRNRGQELTQQARFAEAEQPLESALAAARELGPQDPRLDQALVDLAETREAQGKTEDVIYLRQQSLENRVARFGAASPQAADALYELAEIYFAREEYEQAKGICDMALDTWDQINAGDQMDAARSRLLRGRAFEAQGKLDRAEADIGRALEIQEKALGAENSKLTPTIRALARVVKARGDAARAEALARRITTLKPAEETAPTSPTPPAS